MTKEEALEHVSSLEIDAYTMNVSEWIGAYLSLREFNVGDILLIKYGDEEEEIEISHFDKYSTIVYSYYSIKQGRTENGSCRSDILKKYIIKKIGNRNDKRKST